ncbi:MAG TPA: cyclodeaminase/cyclohydrolase family protein [Phycisphaerae bacterium]|nr:cyclodeaminase/cyclohydrolase family protein [Phycisphaerae bacterium]
MTDQDQDLLSLSVRGFVSATAAKQPTPGGGSVAGVVGALAVGLGEMALNFTKGKKKFAEHEAYYAGLSDRLARAREMFQQLVADDVAAFRNYQEAMRMEDGPEKDEAMDIATAAAIAVPREATKLALALLAEMRELAGKCNPWLISDLVASAALAEATCRLSDYNVRINLGNVKDEAAAGDLRAGSAGDLARAAALREEIEAAAKEHLP